MIVSSSLNVGVTGFVLLLFSSSILIIDAAKWSYDGDNGPEMWATLYEVCDGSSQSPINIEADDAIEMSFDEWKLEGYDEMTLPGTKIENNGHTDQITLEGTYKISGGGLPSTYSATQFHFHWGNDNNEGSEHTKNGVPYPAEIHIVHYDSDNYESILAALAEPAGLAVLGFWVEVGEENKAFEPIIDSLRNVTYKDQEFEYSTQFKLEDLLPSNTDKFYRYSGSLTTPGCFESVVWTVFDEPIQMSQAQLDMFREEQLTPIGENGTIPEAPLPIGHNFRPTQALNGRTVHVGTVLGGGASHVVCYANILSVLMASLLACVFSKYL